MAVPTKGAMVLELAHLTGMDVSEIRAISHTKYFDSMYDSRKSRRSPRQKRAEKIKAEINPDELRAMYVGGASVAGLARHFGCTTWFIFDLFRLHSIKSRPRGFKKKHAYPSKKELENMYLRDRMTQAEIAKAVGCCEGMIQKIMKTYGIVQASRKPCLSRSDALDEYVGAGLGMAKVAKLHGCSVNEVRRALRKHGIQVRPLKNALEHNYRPFKKTVHVE